MMKKTVLLISMSVLLFIAGCAPPAGEVIESDSRRITSPDAGQAEVEKLVEANSDFAFDLYRALGEDRDNLFYSPYSISLALAMTYGGARNETARQMAETLRFNQVGGNLHPVFNSLELTIGKKGKNSDFELNLVNSIWAEQDYEFIEAYLDLLAENYGADIRTLSFKTAPEESRQIINDWVSYQTKDRINDLLPQGIINNLTRMVLTNAIYFNAEWLHKFDPNKTYDGDFTLLDGGKVTVPFMRQRENFYIAGGDGYQAVELLYKGDEISMLVIVPEAGSFEAFEESLNAELIDSILQDRKSMDASLVMPKFTYDSEFSLKETLSGMGMPDAFDEVADFSGMDGTLLLFIRDVVHKAFVAVDEAGTEAAAATAVVMEEESEPLNFRIDRPFIFLIRDIETGSILFLGRVLNPLG